MLARDAGEGPNAALDIPRHAGDARQAEEDARSASQLDDREAMQLSKAEGQGARGLRDRGRAVIVLQRQRDQPSSRALPPVEREKTAPKLPRETAAACDPDCRRRPGAPREVEGLDPWNHVERVPAGHGARGDSGSRPARIGSIAEHVRSFATGVECRKPREESIIRAAGGRDVTARADPLGRHRDRACRSRQENNWRTTPGDRTMSKPRVTRRRDVPSGRRRGGNCQCRHRPPWNCGGGASNAGARGASSAGAAVSERLFLETPFAPRMRV